MTGKMTGAAWALSVLMVGLCGCGKGDSDAIVLKIGHSLDITHPVHLAMEEMARILKEKSGGKVTLQIFPSEVLGSEREMIEQVKMGAIHMVKTSTAPMESFVPVMGVFSLPYVFDDSDHFWKVLSGPIGKKLLDAGTASGFKGLCYYDAGARSFYMKGKAVTTPADLKGMKIRVMESKVSMQMVKSLGGSPTPIAWGELYTSLQQGVVDGAENNPPSFYTSRHYEVCKYYSLDEHTRIPDVILISNTFWKKQSAETQKLIQDAADASSVFQRKLWKEKTADALEKVKAAGVTVTRPDKAPFVAMVKKLHDSYKGTETGKVLDEIKNAK